MMQNDFLCKNTTGDKLLPIGDIIKLMDMEFILLKYGLAEQNINANFKMVFNMISNMA